MLKITIVVCLLISVLWCSFVFGGEWTSPNWGYCCNQELTRIRIYIEQQPGLYGDGLGSGPRVMRYEKDTWKFNPVIEIDTDDEENYDTEDSD